jgi:hypothetical protein
VPALSSTAREDLDLLREGGFGRLPVVVRKISAGEDLLESPDPKPIHSPVAPGELVLVPAVLHRQGLVDEENGKAGADSKPEVIVLASGKDLVE